MPEPHLYQVEDGWLETYTGLQFRFNEPTADMISIDDIAHALSLLCRYNGHVKRFYSVAEHCTLMAYWMRDRGFPKDQVFTALMHDCAEAYIGDMARPVKVTMPRFKELEGRIEQAAAEKFPMMVYPFPKIIKELDSRILNDERTQVMNPSDNVWGTDDLEPLGVTCRFWSPEEAKNRFLGMYISLVRQ